MEVDYPAGSGDIFNAIQVVIQELIAGDKSHSEILYSWDKYRGSDKFENYISKSEIVKFINKQENLI